MSMPDTDLTNLYAGPFCSCGDYSCPASSDSAASCVNRDWPIEEPHYPGWNGVGDPMDTDTWSGAL
ncbi:MAG: hypothetical protein DI630_00930 [Gordonia sp. (in: high G+C Gram-positive bacteria)]|nr:MAG: hypothetical protein DI630_00930 [Gordonia sp. (in: high G+C Gram-positive bacteria)]